MIPVRVIAGCSCCRRLVTAARDQTVACGKEVRLRMDSLSCTAADLPFLTDTPGTGGRYRNRPEDFQVEEQPLYEPSGEGEHALLLVEKCDLTTQQVVEFFSRTLGIPDRDIGVAGRKDRFAVTRQYVTVPAGCLNSLDPEAVSDQLEPDKALKAGEWIRIRSVALHRNKLKTGHLAGNRFEIVVRGLTSGTPLETAQKTAQQIAESGFVNYFGEQRFGQNSDTDQDGFRLLKGEQVRRLSRTAMRFAISAAQSRLFNLWACRRVRDGLTHQVLAGDVMQVLTSGGCFAAEEAELTREQDRFDDRETVVTGPLFGPKMKAARGMPGQRERDVLLCAGLSGQELTKFRRLAPGARRALLVWPRDLTVRTRDENALAFSFTLPPGAYATCLLREFLKAER